MSEKWVWLIRKISPAASQERDFAKDILPLLLGGSIGLFLLCGGPSLGFLGLARLRDTQAQEATATFAAESRATQDAEITATAEAAATAETAALPAQAPPGWQLLYQHDFTESDGYWPDGSYWQPSADTTQKVTDGEYIWTLDSDNASLFWAAPGNAVSLTDFYVSVEARRIEGESALTGYGLMLRQDEDVYYLFEVTEIGNFRFRAREAGWRDIIDWQDTDLIRRDAPNKLTVWVKDNHFVLMINDQVAGQADDATIRQGWVGLAVHMLQAHANVTVAFDNFEVYAP